MKDVDERSNCRIIDYGKALFFVQSSAVRLTSRFMHWLGRLLQAISSSADGMGFIRFLLLNQSGKCSQELTAHFHGVCLLERQFGA